MATPICDNVHPKVIEWLLAFLNLHQHAKNEFVTSVASWDTVFIITRGCVIENLSWTFWLGNIFTRPFYYTEHHFCLHPKDILIDGSRLTWPFHHVFFVFCFAFYCKVFIQLKKKHCNINIEVGFLALQWGKHTYSQF